jgi:hypothetical protein
MNLRLPNNIKTKLERLAYYQIAGGAIGVIMVIWLIAQTVTITGIVILIFVLAIGLDIFSIYCGRLLLKGEHDIGLRLSTINQALQIFSFALFGFAFKFVAGLCLGIGIDYTNDFKFDFNLTISTFEISINTEHELINLGFNFVAVFLIQYIMRIKDEIEDYKLLQSNQINTEILTIGQDITNQENDS